MDNVADNNKKEILTQGNKAPLTVELAGGRVILQEYRIVMRLGVGSSMWLLVALQNVINGGCTQEQAIDHNGQKVLTVLNEGRYIFIIGTNARFVFNREVAKKLLAWFEANCIGNN